MKDGTYTVRLDAEGIPMLTSQINMTDGYWVSDETGVSVHGELDAQGTNLCPTTNGHRRWRGSGCLAK